MVNIWVIAFLYVGLAGCGVGIFLWGKPDGNSLFDRLYRLVCISFPRLVKKALEICFGKRAPAVLDSCWVYVCYTSNPLVQLFYLLVVVGGYLTFAIYGYAHMPNNYVSSHHKYIGFAVFNVCLAVWWTASRADPGTVTAKNVDKLCEIYVWDDLIFSSAECHTCELVKPARSKHCSLCDVCVSRFDHHCIWINNCVGVGNHRWFLYFLFWHLVICFYGGALGSLIIYDLIGQKDLLNAVFVDPVTKERHSASYMIIIQYMLATEGMVVFITCLCLIMGVVLCGFFLWHLNLVRMGTTTNELSKWSYLRWCLKEEGQEEKLKVLRNEYNQGVFANFQEVFAPINVHSLPGSLAKDRSASAQEAVNSGTTKVVSESQTDVTKKRKQAKKSD